MDNKIYDKGPIDIAWCPGCGNFGILNIVKEALAGLEIDPRNLVMVSGIGQAGKLPHYLQTNFFNGLHGRALPPATAIKAANRELVVIAEGGDGDMYGEGGNHFIHAIRRNPNIVNIVHNNMVYGLTKGQASPTSQKDFKTPVQVDGVVADPFNPIAVAVALDASFVARAYCADIKPTVEILMKAIKHRGYALVDIFQPCVSFNKVNTYQWFKEHTYYLEGSHAIHDRQAAFKRSVETDKFPLGIFYVNEKKPVFEEHLSAYAKSQEPLYKRELNKALLTALINSKKE
jgi:2-oxoglutarate ferredoxin oxidoreductase subunit beta